MQTTAVLFRAPGHIEVEEVELSPPGAGDIIVDVAFSGISTGTERLLWSGRMPHFPGLGYPLVPGYESVGKVVEAANDSALVGKTVFVPGARCYDGPRPLFGGTASRLVVARDRVSVIPETLREEAVLLALAATARHALVVAGGAPDLIVGHGVLGRLIARLALAAGGEPPRVWETQPVRLPGARGYAVLHPDADERRDYRRIIDVSGDSGLLDELVSRLAPGGEIVLAGFYTEPLSFAFAPAFMREATLRVAAEWKPQDMAMALRLIAEGRLSLDGLITHSRPAQSARDAYPTAFEEPGCLKMVLDWRSPQ